MKWGWAVLWVLILVGGAHAGVAPVAVPYPLTHVALAGSTEYVVDTGNQMTMSTVRGTGVHWQPVGNVDLNLGYLDKPVWLHTRLHVAQARYQEALLEIGFPLLDRIDLAVFAGDHVVAKHQLGDLLPYGSRPRPHRNFVVPISLAPGEVLDVYMRVESTSTIQIPLTLWGRTAFGVAQEPKLLGDGLAYGFVFSGIAFLLIIARINREAHLLWYLPYPILLTLYEATLEGYAFQFIWPDLPAWNNRAIPVLIFSGIAAGLSFNRRFLAMDTHTPVLAARFSNAVPVLAALTLAACFLPLRATLMASGYALLLFLLFSLYAGVVARKNRSPGSLAHLSSTFLFLLIISAYLLNRTGFVPYTSYLQTGLLMAVLIQVFMLAVIVANRVSEEKSAKHAAIAEQLHSEMLARHQLEAVARALAAAKRDLEQRVSERTAELSRANEDLAAANAELARLSTVDALTGVYNRRHFDEALNKAVRRGERQQQPLTVLMIDADHFKAINDTHGHQAGDQCLRAIAQVLRATCARPDDVVARYGGEEFVVLLPDTPRDAALTIAERIRVAIAALEIAVAGAVIRLTASVGVAGRVPASPEDGALLLGSADKALYVAKHGGRNRVSAAG